jgi:hypothetical protein
MKRAMISAIVVVYTAMAGVASAQTTLPAGMTWICYYNPLQVSPVPAEWPRRSVELVCLEAFRPPRYRIHQHSVSVLRPMWDELSAAQKAAGRSNLILQDVGEWGGMPSRMDEVSRRHLTLIAPPPAGPEDLEAAVRWLRTKLTETKLPDDQRWQRVEETVAKLERNQRFQNIVQELLVAQQKFDPTVTLKRMQDLQAERQKLETDLLARKVRGEAIRKQLGQAEKEARMRLEEDAILKQLEKVLELRVQDIKRVQDMIKNGVGGQADMKAAEERTVETQLRIEERKETLKQGTKGELLSRLSNELALLMVDQTEMEMRLALLREQTLPTDLTKLTEKDLEKVAGDYGGVPDQKHPPILTKLEKEGEELAWELLKLAVVEVRPANPPQDFPKP